MGFGHDAIDRKGQFGHRLPRLQRWRLKDNAEDQNEVRKGSSEEVAIEFIDENQRIRKFGTGAIFIMEFEAQLKK